MEAVTELSEDVLTDILIKYPVKTIARFRCVCKSWRSLISSRAFIRTHLDYATHLYNMNVEKNRFTGAIFYFTSFFEYQKVCPTDQNHDEEDQDQQMDEVTITITNTVLHPPPVLRKETYRTRSKKPKTKLHECEIMACFDGMLCIKNRNSLVLWNPSIHDYVVLPPPRVKFDCAEVIGIGYDTIADDYKILRVPSRKIKKRRCSVEILSLKSKSWKKLILVEFPYQVICSKYSTFTNNGMHWFALRAGTEERMILCFDFVDEKFREVPKPPQSSSGHTRIYGLRIWSRNNLCVVEYNKHGRFEFWMMTKYGVEESWIEIIDSQYSKYLRPGYMKGERPDFGHDQLRGKKYFLIPATDRIGVWLEKRKLVIYKPTDKTSEKIRVCDPCNMSNRVPYVETFVSPSTN